MGEWGRQEIGGYGSTKKGVILWGVWESDSSSSGSVSEKFPLISGNFANHRTNRIESCSLIPPDRQHAICLWPNCGHKLMGE